uniref:50S ribosomal protein L19 n=1 Tax=Nephromyces sp. ex Molgula occidentalis TaxID=2544991 RepID=A0A5C1H819_9APIC|nr:hypothetical protein [Nephromyces sp. ex Molgula occidentalis]
MNNLKKIFYNIKQYPLKLNKNILFKKLKKKSLIKYIYIFFEKNKLKKSIIKGNIYKINKKFLIIKCYINIFIKIPLQQPQINNIELLKT